MNLLTTVIPLFAVIVKTSNSVDVICNQFGFFCADSQHFGTCVDYANGTVIADLVFLMECPYDMACNVNSDPICTEASVTPSTSPNTNTTANIAAPQTTNMTNMTNQTTPAAAPEGVTQANQSNIAAPQTTNMTNTTNQTTPAAAPEGVTQANQSNVTVAAQSAGQKTSLQMVQLYSIPILLLFLKN